jgi:hypothetical protein
MSTQVIGSVNEMEGEVSVMRDGETRPLATGDSIMAGDVITASDTGRASVILSNAVGEPIGNLLIAPTGSVLADTTLKDGQTGFVFEALSDDGVTLANLDPDFAELVELQGVEQAGGGGMFGLFDGGLLAGSTLGGSAAAVGAGAVGIGLLSSGSDEGSGPTGRPGGNVGGSDGGNGGDGGSGGDETGGTTGTPLDAALDPVFGGLADTPLAAVSEPLADGLATLAAMAPGNDSGGDEGGDNGGDASGGTTNTPLDAAFDPIFGGLADTPLAAVSEPVADGLGTLAAMAPSGAGGESPVSGLTDLIAQSPLSAITSMVNPDDIAATVQGSIPV